VHALYFILDESRRFAGEHAAESKRQHFLKDKDGNLFNFLAEPVGASPYDPIIFNNFHYLTNIDQSASSPVDSFVIICYYPVKLEASGVVGACPYLHSEL